MYSALTRKVFNKDFGLFLNTNINQLRRLCWVKNEKDYRLIGLEKDTISIFEGINDIYFNKNTNLKGGDIMFSVSSNIPLNKDFYSRENGEILERNEDAINYINIDPENHETSWIVKIKNFEDISYGNFIHNNPDATREERSSELKNFYNSTRSVPYNYVNNCVTAPNVNESDLINYIIGNH